MLKLNASFQKKVPVADLAFSSKSYMASIEVELPTGLTARQLREKIAQTFALVRDSVEAEINDKSNTTRDTAQEQAQEDSGAGKERAQRRTTAPQGKASNKQIAYILDLGKAREKRLADLNQEAAKLFGVESIYELSKPDASRFVDVLKTAA
jgi:hypothetical protein